MKKNKLSKSRVPIIDTFGNISYSLIVGTALDYVTGLSLTGIITSRISALGLNSLTGGLYGWWREKCFKITKSNKSGKIRKTLVDLLAFNTFQVPLYAVVLTISEILKQGQIDITNIQNGAKYLAIISVLIGPSMGLYMDWFRKLFGIKSAQQGTYKK